MGSVGGGKRGGMRKRGRGGLRRSRWETMGRSRWSRNRWRKERSKVRTVFVTMVC